MGATSFRRLPARVLAIVVCIAAAASLTAASAAPAKAETAVPAVAIAADPLGPGYWVLFADGRVVPHGTATGSAPAVAARTTALAAYPTGKGFWRERRSGSTAGFGSATFERPAIESRDSRLVGLATHPSGQGFWRVTWTGRVYASGASEQYGRVPTDEPVRGVAAHPEQAGYWVVNRTGRVFAFGAARVLGTAAPAGATGIAAHPGGDGYWVVNTNGTVTAYGSAVHYGNARMDVPIVDIAAAPDGGGYWLLARDGRVRAFGSAQWGMISTQGPPTPELVTVRGIVVASTLAPDLRRMLTAADAAGIRYGGYGYRSYTRQVELRQQNCGVRYYDVFVKSSSECSPMTAVPGRSMHERGLAIDVFRYRADGSTADIAGTRAFRWLKNNAVKYGLFNLPSEPWHWSTTGG